MNKTAATVASFPASCYILRMYVSVKITIRCFCVLVCTEFLYSIHFQIDIGEVLTRGVCILY